MTTEEKYRKLLEKAQKEFGFDCDTVKRLLKKHGYSGVKSAALEVFVAILRTEWILQDEARIEEEKKKAEDHTANLNREFLCPVCGARAHGDIDLFGIYTRTFGWRCDKGGDTHYYWARVNETLQKQGKNPLPWEAFANARTYSDQPTDIAV